MIENSCKKKVSPEFRNLLIELTKEFLTEAPEDVIEFAIDFFSRKQQSRITKLMVNEDIDSINLSEVDFDPEDPGNRTNIFQGSIDIPDDISEEIIVKDSTVKKKLKDEMRKILIFNSLMEEDLDHLVDLMKKREVKKSEVIVEEGDVGDFFYVIEDGRFTAYKLNGKETAILKTYENNGYFGELALLYDIPRSCSVRADTDGQLWSLERRAFRRTVVQATADRRRQYVEFLSRVPLLKRLSEGEKLDLADCLEAQVYPPSSRIIKEGDQANGMFFILKGTARVSVQRAGRSTDLEVKRIGEGEYFGELALVTHKPRAASVYAVTEVHVAFLDTQSFERLLGPCIERMKHSIAGYKQEINALQEF